MICFGFRGEELDLSDIKSVRKELTSDLRDLLAYLGGVAGH